MRVPKQRTGGDEGQNKASSHIADESFGGKTPKEKKRPSFMKRVTKRRSKGRAACLRHSYIALKPRRGTGKD